MRALKRKPFLETCLLLGLMLVVPGAFAETTQRPSPSPSPSIGAEDAEILQNLDFFENMELLEHWDSTQEGEGE